jgi:hypothetical protein
VVSLPAFHALRPLVLQAPQSRPMRPLMPALRWIQPQLS